MYKLDMSSVGPLSEILITYGVLRIQHSYSIGNSLVNMEQRSIRGAAPQDQPLHVYGVPVWIPNSLIFLTFPSWAQDQRTKEIST